MRCFMEWFDGEMAFMAWRALALSHEHEFLPMFELCYEFLLVPFGPIWPQRAGLTGV